MKNQQGFSLVELLIVVAIIAIIAAIAVPSLLTSRMAANEAGGIQGCRTAGSAEVAYASTNNAQYALIQALTDGNYLDTRYLTGLNGYVFTEDQTVTGGTAGGNTVPTGFGFIATPDTGAGRYIYGIGPDQVVRYQGLGTSGTTDPVGLTAGDGIGKKK
jgi:prepilin-type N-terminal cleavage/methylation domain-containing protein